MPSRNQISRKPKLVFVGGVEAGYFCAEALIESGIKPSAVVCMDARNAQKNKVSGYRDFFDLKTTCRHYRPKSFNLKDPRDIAFFREQKFDLLIVLGWQRLIPDEILETLGIGGLTIHGSGEGLPKGRGRSPMNWAILKGFKKFYLSLLTLESKADSGKILDTQAFNIFPQDNIRTLYYKNALAASRLLVRNIPLLLKGKRYGRSQDESKATYYPKREEKDGLIRWSSRVEEIESLIRATTRPYPGAFSILNGKKIRIWRAQKFDHHLKGTEKPGTVAAVFPDNAFIVQCRDGYLLVEESTGPRPKKGGAFGEI